jgi:hypothetical protein
MKTLARRYTPVSVDDDVGRESGGDIEASGFDMVAASIRADAADTDTFFRVLVAKLRDALGDRVTVSRAGGLIKRDRPVTGVSMDLTHSGEGMVLAAERDRGDISCTVVRRVRGIALSTKQVAMQEWIEQLVAALAEEAKRSEQTSRALNGLLS